MKSFTFLEYYGGKANTEFSWYYSLNVALSANSYFFMFGLISHSSAIGRKTC